MKSIQFFTSLVTALCAVLVGYSAGAESITLSFTNNYWGYAPGGYTEYPGHDPSRLSGKRLYATGIQARLPFFDPALGTLNDIRISVGLELNTSSFFSYRLWFGAPVYATASETVEVTSLALYLGQGSGTVLFSSIPAPVSGSLQILSNSFSGESLSLQSYETTTLTDAAAMAQLTAAPDNAGGSWFTLDAQAAHRFGGSYVDGGVSLQPSWVSFSVIYDYTPVPEPSVVGLLLLTAAALLKSRSRSCPSRGA